jgi:hypothetical protein
VRVILRTAGLQGELLGGSAGDWACRHGRGEKSDGCEELHFNKNVYYFKVDKVGWVTSVRILRVEEE